MRDRLDTLRAAGPIRTEYPLGRTPLLSLVKALAARRDLRSVRLMSLPATDARDDCAV